ncbi:hypothetical protein BKA65DRAFT_552869 [Rhexocercosporidium sp. MPI-PUGE-AT-0058]|nr:hypothetical protein BKA65DRAFT_552869 [Rhexocercosporidium sp. MPI-PUGE-AT-0058]
MTGHNSVAEFFNKSDNPDTVNNNSDPRQQRLGVQVINKTLIGRPKKTQQQQQAPTNFNDRLAAKVEKVRAERSERAKSNGMSFGVAPANDAARRRAEGKMHTPNEFLHAMATKFKAHRDAEAAERKHAEQVSNGMRDNEMKGESRQPPPEPRFSNIFDQSSSTLCNPNIRSEPQPDTKGVTMEPTWSESSAGQQEFVNKNRNIIDSLKRDLLYWYQVNVMCYDVRHFSLTIESHNRINNSVRYFSDNQRTELYALPVPSSIPDHVISASPNGSSNIEDPNVDNLEMLLDHLREMSVAEAERHGRDGPDAWKDTYFKDLAPFFEYSIAIFDGGRQLENRLWFLELMSKYDLYPPIEELREWGDKMKGVHGIQEGPITSELASLWRKEAGRGMKPLEEWIKVIKGE